MANLKKFGPEHGGPLTHNWLYVRDDDEDGLYRAVASDYLHVLKIANGADFYIPHELTDVRMDVYGPHKACHVIRVRRLPFQVRIQELTRAQALRCVLFLVDFVRYCHASHGVMPADIHEGNLLWWDRPYFVDYDAIRPLTHAWAAYTFVRIAYLLYRYVLGHELLFHEHFTFVQLRALDGWMSDQTERPDFTDPSIWTELRDVIADMQTPPPPATHWSSEYAIAKLDDLGANPKFAAILKLAPPGRTMIDVGCNRGYTGHLLRDRYKYILGFDKDEGCIEGARPVPEVNYACFGIEHLDYQTRRDEAHPILGRFSADVVVALAVTHHFDTLKLPVSMVARVLAGLTKKHLLIEDIANVGDYNQQFREHGLVVADHCPSYPSGRTLTLWKRG